MTQTQQFKLNLGGDILDVEWNGSVWIAPSCGSQHAHAADALRVEISRYYRASGDDLDADDIESVKEYGEWLEEDA